MRKRLSVLALITAAVSCMPAASMYANAEDISYSEEDEVAAVLYDGNTAEPVPGDVNGDGRCTMADAVILQKWLLAEPDTEIYDWMSADLNGNDRIDVFDFILLKQQLLGTESSSPIAGTAQPLLVIEDVIVDRAVQNILVYDNSGTAYHRYFSNGYASYSATGDDYVEKDAAKILFSPDGSWYDALTDIISRPYAEYNGIHMDEDALSYVVDFAKKTPDYKEESWLDSSTHTWDGVDINIYIIDTGSDDGPAVAKLCTLGRYDQCLDNEEVQDFVMEICRKGYTDWQYLDLELESYLKANNKK